MRVTPKPESPSAAAGWLMPNETLTVLAISGGSKFLLWSKLQECVALFPASEFEIVDGRLSSSWTASVDLNGYVYLAPIEWHGDFWDRYNEDEAAASKEFHEVMTKIERE